MVAQTKHMSFKDAHVDVAVKPLVIVVAEKVKNVPAIIAR